jgi:hypothetical protein
MESAAGVVEAGVEDHANTALAWAPIGKLEVVALGSESKCVRSLACHGVDCGCLVPLTLGQEGKGRCLVHGNAALWEAIQTGVCCLQQHFPGLPVHDDGVHFIFDLAGLSA